MLYVVRDSLDAAFCFSAEEFLMGNGAPGKPAAMVWRTDPCVMLGRYQVALAEADMNYANASGIGLVRRSSGGGAIYTDPGAIQFTLILESAGGQQALQNARDTVAGVIIAVLAELGVAARSEGRNDIVVEGYKVSGMAQYAMFNRVCTHASILYDANLETLARVLRPDEEKVRSRGIRSVRSRVTNITEHMRSPTPVLEFMEIFYQYLQKTLRMREYAPAEADLSLIRQIQRDKYANPRWTLESSPLYTVHTAKRFPGGHVDVFLEVQKEVVTACAIRGDFLGTVPVRGLEELLEGLAYRLPAFENALSDVSLYAYLGSVSKEQLLQCIFEC